MALDSLMNKLPATIKNELIEYRDIQENLVSVYLDEKNLEMAYIARWSILEKLVKTVATEYRRKEVIASLTAWLSHFNDHKERPAKKPNTAIEAKTLPLKSEFIASLNYFGLLGNAMWGVMDSKGRHRRNRNEIAHTGKKFINYLAFMSLMSDMSKVLKRVYNKIESN